MVPSREGSTAGRRVPVRPQFVVSRGAGRSARPSTAAKAPSQVMGRVLSHRSGAIPGTRVLPVPGAPRLPAGLSSSAQSARGPGAEPAPGSKLTSRGRSRGRRLGRPPAPPRCLRRPRCHEEDHCIDWWS
ncbi:hypothetical protein NDU88_004507 [Pleurodeles waltl]|uniref:Uncharacterized protein n=1 Tax=Pleurodeles waltl TaxID=8319 RepID=A0AAV7UFP1_PLEWA|nr:hypothetical protein NDU88_004507 [Pleurodeles waltl]